MTPSELRACLARHGLHLSRERGQNFLLDDSLADRLVRLAGVDPGDRVLEVGTGLGVLSRALARRGARVETVEIDAGLVRVLAGESLLPEGARLHHADALALDWSTLAEPPDRVVANLPYSVATPFLRGLLDRRGSLRDWSVMVQRELAERITAGPGEPGYGSFAVLHHWCVRAEVRASVPARCFFPQPQVASAFVRFEPVSHDGLGPGELARLEPWLRAGFGQRRKTLVNAVAAAGRLGKPAITEVLAAMGLDARVRAEALTPEEHLALARALEAVR